MDDHAVGYGSYGKGSSMRVSPVAWVADMLEGVLPSGEIDDSGEEVYEKGGVRPAMWLKL